MIYLRKNIYIVIFISFIIILIFLGYYYNRDTSFTNTSVPKNDTTPVPIADWASYISNYGFSFMHPTGLEVKENENELAVGGINVKIEKLNCTSKKPSKEITSESTLYGFKAQINEPAKIAYICNNANTACLDISTNKSKITEGFFHSFISSLNLNEDFDKIECIK